MNYEGNLFEEEARKIRMQISQTTKFIQKKNDTHAMRNLIERAG
jgi:hypothetical protein